MNQCPIVELMITFKYGIPLFSWTNENKIEMASNAGNTIESSNLIGGLLSAILSFSETISMENDQVLQQIKMANCTYQYHLSDDLIFFLGFDTGNADLYEEIIDQYFFDTVEYFNKLYSDLFGNDIQLSGQSFDGFQKYLEDSMNSEIWRVERTQKQQLEDIKELLLDILGPMSNEIYDSNLKQLKYKSRGRAVDLTIFADNMVREISLLMDPAQAVQIGQEIQSLITVGI